MNDLLLAQAMNLQGIWLPAVSILAPMFIWGVWLSNAVATVKRESHRLIWMHENADEAGFGTVKLRSQHEIERREMREMMENNTRAMREVAHYIRFCIEETTGKKPPPPMPTVLAEGV